MRSRPSPPAALTALMEADGCFLETSDDGGVHIRCHEGNGAGLSKWAVPSVLAHIEKHKRAIWHWLRTPCVDDLPKADIESLFGPIGGEQEPAEKAPEDEPAPAEGQRQMNFGFVPGKPQ
ncbi:MAG: hypothetical protein O7F08_08685 [Deltaproteobacteria bacterium]|nr:hypothetical protein [Deltaproteobacteria bacterium]